MWIILYLLIGFIFCGIWQSESCEPIDFITGCLVMVFWPILAIAFLIL